MTPLESTTRQLFREAVATVRQTPLVPPGRPPAMQLERPTWGAPTPGRGPVDGLAGDLWETSEAVRGERISVGDVIAAASQRIAEHGRRLGAFEYVADVRGITEQLDSAARRGEWRGALHGLPISVKDVIDVGLMPTRGSSAALAARVASRDATAVARLRGAGAVLMGKVSTHEFALGVTTPQARSPWDESRVPGGSSGGSAISLVTGMALGSLGTDTRASIRVPAALCGLVGYKPSLGVVPVDRWLTLSWTMDHFAPMARSVRDIALLMDVLTERPAAFTGVLPGRLEGLRVGWSAAVLAGAAPAVSETFRAALQAMAAGGAKVREIATPSADDLSLANAAGMVVSRAEAADFHREAGTRIEACIPEVRDQLSEAGGLLATDYVRAMRLRGLLRERLVAAFEEVDLLAMPTSKVVAPKVEEADQFLLVLSENCIPWSFVDFPAISLPAGLADGLPAGIQLVGAPGRDLNLLSAAHAAERLLPKVLEWRPDDA